MAIDISKVVYTDDPEWLSRIAASNGRDDGEVLAISPEFLGKAAETNDSGAKARWRKSKDGKELLELMLGK